MTQGARNPSLSVRANEDQTVWGWKRTCNFLRDGTWLTREPPCRILHVDFSHVHCTDVAIYLGLIFILFDVDSGHEGHSGEIPLFEGYYVS